MRYATYLLAALAFALGNSTNQLDAAEGQAVFKVVMVEDLDGDPVAAGKQAGEQLLKAMGDAQLKAVFISECFEDREYKEELMQGLRAVLPAEKLFGGSSYGAFTQDGCTDFDSVCLLGIGGPGVDVSTALVTDMGVSKLIFDESEALVKERLHAAGDKLMAGLKRTPQDRLLILFGDAHSPKVQYLVEGVQKTVGPRFAITGGCANKNAGQTFIYYKGEFHEDAAIALMLSGDFNVSLAGRQAMEEQAVIDSAKDGAEEAIAAAPADDSKPTAVLAFNCAGRRSKLNDYADELAAMQSALGKTLPLFGCYNAGEIGPVEDEVKKEGVRCGGSGWHVMYTVIWQ